MLLCLLRRPLQLADLNVVETFYLVMENLLVTHQFRSLLLKEHVLGGRAQQRINSYLILTVIVQTLFNGGTKAQKEL